MVNSAHPHLVMQSSFGIMFAELKIKTMRLSVAQTRIGSTSPASGSITFPCQLVAEVKDARLACLTECSETETEFLMWVGLDCVWIGVYGVSEGVWGCMYTK